MTYALQAQTTMELAIKVSHPVSFAESREQLSRSEYSYLNAYKSSLAKLFDGSLRAYFF